MINIIKSIIAVSLANNNTNNSNDKTNLTGTNSSSFFNLSSTGANISGNNIDSLLSLNNCLKWFYFNSETTRKINNSILSLLNNNINGVKVSLYFSLYNNLN